MLAFSMPPLHAISSAVTGRFLSHARLRLKEEQNLYLKGGLAAADIENPSNNPAHDPVQRPAAGPLGHT